MDTDQNGKISQPEFVAYVAAEFDGRGDISKLPLEIGRVPLREPYDISSRPQGKQPMRRFFHVRE